MLWEYYVLYLKNNFGASLFDLRRALSCTISSPNEFFHEFTNLNGGIEHEVIDSWHFDNFILVDVLFAKTFRSIESSLSVNNILFGK